MKQPTNERAASGHDGPMFSPDRNKRPIPEAEGRKARFERPAPPQGPPPAASGQNGPTSPNTGNERRGPEKNGRRFRSEHGEAASSPPPGSPKWQKTEEARQDGGHSRLSDRLHHDGSEAPPGGSPHGSAAGPDKKAARSGMKTEKSRLRAEKSGAKLDAAREKLAAQKPKRPGTMKAILRRAGAGAWYYAHQKIHEVEHENVGVEAVHKTELAGESAVRGVTRFVKHRIRTHPARRVAKLEKRDIRAKADYAFRKLAQEHPEVTSNPVSRHLQKQRLKKQYAKQARTAAKQGARTAKGVAATVQRIGRAVWAAATSHPVAALVVLGVLLLILALQSCVASMGTIGSGLIGAVGAGTYTASDADMLAAEAAYSEMETKLQNEAANYAVLHPGYDEYRYDLDTVGHDPYVLISILSALHDGAWTLDEVQDTLSTLFAKQYQLTQTLQTETRTRMETSTVTGADGGTSTVTTQVPYNYTICTVSLHNEDLSHLPVSVLTEEQLSRYAFYMKTHGNRSDLFPQSQYPNASVLQSYTDYDIPKAYMQDKTFAGMMTEAKKYLGYPYVWGGSSPETSFDCSGYVSWVLNHSGWDVGRLSAQGLYDICTPIPASGAKPGDLVFFVGTYDTTGISHVGIYVGDGMMIAAGDPIGYSDITTSYWQSHFYAFGRLP